MILEEGKTVLIVHRRLFESDNARYFAGLVEGYEGGIVKARGFTWSRDNINGAYLKKPDIRIKIFSIVSGGVMAYELPDGLDPSRLEIKGTKGSHQIVLTGPDGFSMDLTERAHA